MIPAAPALPPPPLEAMRPAGPHAAVGARVTAMRRGLGFSLEGFAARLAVPRPTLARIERGDVVPRAALLLRLAKAGQRSAEWLLQGPRAGGPPEPTPAPLWRRRLPRLRRDVHLGPYRAIGERVEAARRRLGLTQWALADRAGVDRRTVGRLERGGGLPHAGLLARLAKALGLTISALVGEDALGSSPAEAARDPSDPRHCGRCGAPKPEAAPGPRLPRHRRYDVKLGPFIAVGTRVIMLRHRLRWSRDELARRAGVGRMTLARLERGEGCPTVRTLARIATTGRVTVDWLLTGRTGEEGT